MAAHGPGIPGWQILSRASLGPTTLLPLHLIQEGFFTKLKLYISLIEQSFKLTLEDIIFCTPNSIENNSVKNIKSQLPTAIIVATALKAAFIIIF